MVLRRLRHDTLILRLVTSLRAKSESEITLEGEAVNATDFHRGGSTPRIRILMWLFGHKLQVGANLSQPEFTKVRNRALSLQRNLNAKGIHSFRHNAEGYGSSKFCPACGMERDTALYAYLEDLGTHRCFDRQSYTHIQSHRYHRREMWYSEAHHRKLN